MSDDDTSDGASEGASTKKRKKGAPDWVKGNALLAPTTVWLLILLMVPLVVVVTYSLGHRSRIPPVRVDWGDLQWGNYGDALNPDFLPDFSRSVRSPRRAAHENGQQDHRRDRERRQHQRRPPRPVSCVSTLEPSDDAVPEVRRQLARGHLPRDLIDRRVDASVRHSRTRGSRETSSPSAALLKRAT